MLGCPSCGLQHLKGAPLPLVSPMAAYSFRRGATWFFALLVGVPLTASVMLLRSCEPSELQRTVLRSHPTSMSLHCAELSD
jgi:hypothetical protein